MRGNRCERLIYFEERRTRGCRAHCGERRLFRVEAQNPGEPPLAAADCPADERGGKGGLARARGEVEKPPGKKRSRGTAGEREMTNGEVSCLSLTRVRSRRRASTRQQTRNETVYPARRGQPQRKMQDARTRRLRAPFSKGEPPPRGK